MRAQTRIHARFAIFAAATLCVLGAPTVQAEIVTFRVDGTITAVQDPFGLAEVPAAVGDRYSLFYTFDTESPGILPGTGPANTLRYEDSILSMVLVVAGAQLILPPASLGGQIQITDNLCNHPLYPCEDWYSVSTWSGSIVDELLLTHFGLYAQSPVGTAGPTALNSVLLSASPPDPSLFSQRGVGFSWHDGPSGNSGSISGSVESISAVPLPAPLWLLGSVLLGGAGFRRGFLGKGDAAH